MQGFRELGKLVGVVSRRYNNGARLLLQDSGHTSVPQLHRIAALSRHLASLTRVSLSPRVYPGVDGDGWNEEYNARAKEPSYYEERFGNWLLDDVVTGAGAEKSAPARGSRKEKETAAPLARGSKKDSTAPRKGSKQKKERPHHKSFRLRTEKFMQPFMLDVYFSKRFITASIMHRVTSRVVAVCNTNNKEFRGRLRSYCDVNACKLVAEKLAERATDADVYAVVYEPRKQEKFEGKLKTLVDAVGANGIHLYLP